jgi:hypothetical protein
VDAGGVRVVVESGASSRKRKHGTRPAVVGAFGRAAKAAGVPDAAPFSPRHLFCSLLLHEGRSVIDTADRLAPAQS